MTSTSDPTLSSRANADQLSLFASPDHAQAIDRYLHLTRDVMPRRAQHANTNWPVVNDHCFQRIVLDAVCGGVWYDYIPRPAHKHLTKQQAKAAVALCEAIIDGDADLRALNRQSLIWRGK